MNKLGCLIILFFTCGVCSGQNLIPNPSFEDTIYCPTDLGHADALQYWLPLGDTPDYFTPNGCGSFAGRINVPDNYFGYQNAYTGIGYVGMYCYIPFTNQRELITTGLLDSLVIGQKYFITMQISLAGGLTFTLGCNKFGCKLSTRLLPFNTFPVPDNYAQFYSDLIYTDTLNWVRIKGSFIADSVYTFIAFGNFFDSSQTDTLGFGQYPVHTYYYLDDVCLSTDSLLCNPPVKINNTNYLILFPNPFTDEINITANTTDLAKVNLFDITGRKIFHQSFINSTVINTGQFARGIYLYEVSYKNGVIKKGKVVKD